MADAQNPFETTSSADVNKSIRSNTLRSKIKVILFSIAIANTIVASAMLVWPGFSENIAVDVAALIKNRPAENGDYGLAWQFFGCFFFIALASWLGLFLSWIAPRS